VGRHAARFLADRGAKLVAASDTHGTLANASGIDVARLSAVKARTGSVLDYSEGERLPQDAILDTECDIWIPAARPDVLREDNAGRLRTRLVLQGANIPFTDAAERALASRNVLVIPDFVANAGGVICAAMEYHGATRAAAFDAIAEKVRANTAAVIESARASRILPREAALALALDGVRKAMGLRRWSAAQV
jgi:glutamate dehydrogenase (NAD(P)+)